ncbi:hypothetical protein KM043_006370 [Ampulex compressa]|nr:hypothetical protein KM043_006370 [Ampulex compressa]
MLPSAARGCRGVGCARLKSLLALFLVINEPIETVLAIGPNPSSAERLLGALCANAARTSSRYLRLNVRKISYGVGPGSCGIRIFVRRYGLLGASGCGKTTLLSCVVGVRKLDSGNIWVLGGHPGTKGSGIPGPRVGYMPQEISLVEEFTVLGALYYFGRINGLDDWLIEDRYTFLKDLLQLPPKNRLIKNMSGGQQRRVSFAAALIHKPELLILDEPTVGLDPVLRDNIWNYLVKITEEDQVTVIITTHYIEEAKQASKIGLMRCGLLLAESSPNELLEEFQCDSLEEAFLTLSQRQKESQERGGPDLPSTFTPRLENVASSMETYQKSHVEAPANPVRKKYTALFSKNFVQFFRHPGGILFALLLPLIQVMIFFNAIGDDPKELKISVVNEEAGHCDYGKYLGNVTYDAREYECTFSDLSCRFLDGFNDTIATKTYYDSLESATNAVKKGQTVGVMFFSSNFSQALQSRIEDFRSATTGDIVAGQIQVNLDMSNRQIGLHMKRRLFERFFDVYEEVVQECQIPQKFAKVPIRFEDPIFGIKEQKYSTFVAPVFLLTLTFFLSTSVASSIIIADRHAGVWDRSLVQGVTTPEILVSHLLTQLVVIIIQVVVALCLSFFQFDLECKGSLSAAIWLVLLEGICGMCYGFLISVMCTSHTVANYISTGSFYPVILLCGCVWPVEGMPKLLRWLSFTLPTTIPGISLRGVMDKGYPMSEPEVYSGFLVVGVWITCLVLVSLYGLRSKSG